MPSHPIRKRSYDSVDPSCLHDALVFVESHGTFHDLEMVKVVWKKIDLYRPAKVLLAKNKIAAKFFADTRPLLVEQMVGKNLDLYREVLDCREYPCCRGPALAKHLPSSEIAESVRPLMAKRIRGKKLSNYSALIEVLMKYTHVNVDHDGLEEWDQVEEWINAKGQEIPLLAEIADPVFMFIRGPGGGAPPAWIQSQLDAIPVGRPAGGLSQAATAANVVVRRAPGQPPIPNCFQFADMADAKMVRSHLQAHANAQAAAAGAALAGAQLDILRLSVQLGGFVWI